jgi:GntR family transcriptional regulator
MSYVLRLRLVTTSAQGVLRRLETRSLVSQAKEALVDSIIDGGFPDGRLPSEVELARQLGVSRPTIRVALTSLEEEGLVTRQRGVGTRVNQHVVGSRISMNRVVGFYDLIREAGFDPGIAWTRVSEGPAPPDASQLLGCDEGSPLVLVERLFLADGAPALHLVEMILPEFLRHGIRAEDVPNSVFALADAHCRTLIDHSVVEVIPIVTTPQISELLPLSRGEPLLRLIETHYAVDGTPFIVSRIQVVDRYLRFTVVRRRV